MLGRYDKVIKRLDTLLKEFGAAQHFLDLLLHDCKVVTETLSLARDKVEVRRAYIFWGSPESLFRSRAAWHPNAGRELVYCFGFLACV